MGRKAHGARYAHARSPDARSNAENPKRTDRVGRMESHAALWCGTTNPLLNRITQKLERPSILVINGVGAARGVCIGSLRGAVFGRILLAERLRRITAAFGLPDCMSAATVYAGDVSRSTRGGSTRGG